eukprot:TRINITY_DN5085_c0_g1_i1.p1 TRINITY_DN5085_c0_g1~~TRINITY_DN5085_c0_g1_i1.p1  ORF type:complete len:191 (-),score=37.71 TRINITY_DN5085_c0_g1_i1:132-704(-)
MIRNSNIEKTYIAKVIGEFPEGEIDVNEPILMSKRRKPHQVHPDGKPSRTLFKRLSYCKDSDTSILRCIPITGRTHQIRIHTKHLGHPIVGDPIYGPINEDEGTYEEIWENRREYLKNKSETPPENISLESECIDCCVPIPDPPLEKLTQCLHSYSYKCNLWHFKTKIPQWAEGITEDMVLDNGIDNPPS